MGKNLNNYDISLLGGSLLTSAVQEVLVLLSVLNKMKTFRIYQTAQ